MSEEGAPESIASRPFGNVLRLRHCTARRSRHRPSGWLSPSRPAKPSSQRAVSSGDCRSSRRPVLAGRLPTSRTRPRRPAAPRGYWTPCCQGKRRLCRPVRNQTGASWVSQLKTVAVPNPIVFGPPRSRGGPPFSSRQQAGPKRPRPGSRSRVCTAGPGPRTARRLRVRGRLTGHGRNGRLDHRLAPRYIAAREDGRLSYAST